MRVRTLAAIWIATAGAAAAEPFAYTIVDAAAVPAPLGGVAGNAGRGAAAFARACGACHDAAAFARAEPGALRLAIVDLSVLRPDAADHAFYDTDEEGRTRLSARTVEDIVAFLGGGAAEPGR